MKNKNNYANYIFLIKHNVNIPNVALYLLNQMKYTSDISYLSIGIKRTIELKLLWMIWYAHVKIDNYSVNYDVLRNNHRNNPIITINE